MPLIRLNLWRYVATGLAAPCLIAAFFASQAFSDNAIYRGHPRVVDGDTLEIGGQVIRMHGIDAFERSQSCGQVACGHAAAEALWQMVYGKWVTCTDTGQAHTYGRAVAICKTAEIDDLGGHLVTMGWALDWPRYSRGAYAQAQADAKAAGNGVWATGQFVSPWVYRQSGRHSGWPGIGMTYRRSLDGSTAPQEAR